MSLFTSVYVIDVEGKPLLPTNQARARILLKEGKAIVHTVEPFTIKLNRMVENPVGEFKAGIDDGSEYAGISVAYKDKVVFAGNIKLRQDVSRKMGQRKNYRRTRRSRNLRHRKPRFLNRKKNCSIPPSIRCKKDAILRVIDDLKKRLNIIEIVIEQGQFDVSSESAGYKLTGKGYQQSEYKGNNWRQKVLWRDSYKCRKCKSQDMLNAHHIRHRVDGGTNRVSNGITLCKDCHESLHKGKWKLNVSSGGQLKYPTHLQQGKWYLFNELKKRVKRVYICFGWMTAKMRRIMELEKDHHTDASAMIKANKYLTPVFTVIPRRTKVWEDNPTKTCEERNGFKHWDIIKAGHRRLGYVVGSIRSLKKQHITIRTKGDNEFPVSYSKSRLLWRPAGIKYCRI